jgi:hypothetical protein
MKMLPHGTSPLSRDMSDLHESLHSEAGSDSIYWSFALRYHYRPLRLADSYIGSTTDQEVLHSTMTKVKHNLLFFLLFLRARMSEMI